MRGQITISPSSLSHCYLHYGAQPLLFSLPTLLFRLRVKTNELIGHDECETEPMIDARRPGTFLGTGPKRATIACHATVAEIVNAARLRGARTRLEVDEAPVFR